MALETKIFTSQVRFMSRIEWGSRQVDWYLLQSSIQGECVGCIPCLWQCAVLAVLFTECGCLLYLFGTVIRMYMLELISQKLSQASRGAVTTAAGSAIATLSSRRNRGATHGRILSRMNRIA